jgi:23S rRNA pseudouridine1911/1915/1917 synthase
MNFTILEKNSAERLDKFLTDQLPSHSRSQLQKLIKQGLVTVNKQTVSPKHSLNTGDLVVVHELTPEETARPTESPLFEQIVIIDEQPSYLVINKPAGLIVHPATSLPEPALTDWLIKKYPEIVTVGEDATRPGIVHRLDKDVSGLLIVARDQTAFLHFKKLFQGRRLKKIYTAIAHGQVLRDAGVIDFLIERSASGHKMAARPKNQEGKVSETHFEVQKRFIHYTLLQILIKTGRTHQIRAHLAAYSNPIVGDNLYGGHLAKVANKKLGTKRIYLAATQLEFKDPGGEKKNYQLDMPMEFTELMKLLK